MKINNLDDIVITSKKIGYGGLADVFLGFHKKSKLPLAIKIMNIRNIHPKDWININREISNHENLKNEYIIRLYNHFKINNKLYLILEFAENGNLFNYIYKNKKVIETKEIAKIIYELVSALEYLYQKNILHRDLKPENLLLNNNLKLKLSDFGWCAKYSKIEDRKSFCGTLEYMAPEILENNPQDHKIDIWSIGVWLYELYHKESPFKNLNPNEMINKIINKDYSINNNLDRNAKNLILKLLSYDKNERLNLTEIKTHPFIKNNYKIIEKRFKYYINKKIPFKNDYINNNNHIISKQINLRNKQKLSFKNFYVESDYFNKFKNINNNISSNKPVKIIKVTRSVDKNLNKYSNNIQNINKNNIISYNKDLIINNKLNKNQIYKNNFNFIPHIKSDNYIN